MKNLELTGQWVRLESLGSQHVQSLWEAARSGGPLYHWSPVPKSEAEMHRYVENALAWRDAGTAVPFAIVRLADGAVIGSTRFWNIEYWAWPSAHVRFGRGLPDACEIGYTWLAPSAIRTAANTEAKKLLLEHAFETWDVLRVCFHADVRNERSRRAIERIGGRFEGVLRAHRIAAADHNARDSARYSILASEWPSTKQRLVQMLERREDVASRPTE